MDLGSYSGRGSCKVGALELKVTPPAAWSLVLVVKRDGAGGRNVPSKAPDWTRTVMTA